METDKIEQVEIKNTKTGKNKKTYVIICIFLAVVIGIVAYIYYSNSMKADEISKNILGKTFVFDGGYSKLQKDWKNNNFKELQSGKKKILIFNKDGSCTFKEFNAMIITKGYPELTGTEKNTEINNYTIESTLSGVEIKIILSDSASKQLTVKYDENNIPTELVETNGDRFVKQ